MTPRIFDDQDAFEPAAHSARLDGGYLFGGDSWERTTSIDDSPRPSRRPRPVPTQAQPHFPWHEAASYDNVYVLPDLDEDELPPPRPTQARTGQTRSGRRAAAQRARMRRRRSLLLLVALIAVTAVVADLVRGSRSVILASDPAGLPTMQAAPPPAEKAPAEPAPSADKPSKGPAPAAIPVRGAGTFVYAPGTSKVFGAAGTLRKYQVVVEKGTERSAATFAAAADATLSDARSWIAGRNVRFQRVPQGQSHDFVIYLATEATSEKMCAVGGLQTNRYTSCRLPGQVIINLARWLIAVPNYGASLTTYRQYVINHEVGHQLEFRHEACGGKGQLAPVMQQQTLGLNGCKANAWPYVNGARFSGNIIP